MSYSILVVDDNREYVGAESMIATTVTHVEHSWDAVRELRRTHYDEVWLDYDLHGDDKGSNVTRFIRDNLDRIDYFHTTFYIHSFNPAGRTSMQMILRDTGIEAVMTDLKNFKDKPKITSF